MQLPPLAAPPVEPQAALRCARLIAASAEWKADGEVELFTQLLDDYTDRGIGAAEFRAFLEGRGRIAGKGQKERIASLEVGLLRMVQLLAALFDPIDDPTARRNLGAFFAYWIARFFGCRRGKSGYRQYDPSWMPTARRIAPAHELDLVQQVWDQLRELP